MPVAESAQPRVEVTQNTLPRFDAWDTAISVPRLDLTVLPKTGSGVGVAVGMSGFQTTPAATSPGSSAGLNFDLGVHWRHVTHDRHRVDVTAYRRLTADADPVVLPSLKQPTYGARVELNMAPVKKPGFVVDRGIGLQLESGARITVRRSNGKPMVYYRSTF